MNGFNKGIGTATEDIESSLRTGLAEDLSAEK
jgi:hypothetical protein